MYSTYVKQHIIFAFCVIAQIYLELYGSHRESKRACCCSQRQVWLTNTALDGYFRPSVG